MVDLSSLNPKQQDAVLYNEGPMMILAGAGSGKTRTLVAKIQYLLDEIRLSPHQLLAVTFSNKAAREMRERVALEVEMDIGALNITTFHSFCARVLRSEATYIGLSRNFTIYDDSESLSLIKSIMGKRGISTKELSPQTVKYYIADLKNQGYYPGVTESAQELYGRDEFDFSDDELYPLYLDYEAEISKSNAVDFGGLIIGVIKLFEKFPDVLERYHRRFQYLLVDEYQDTNRAQFILLNLLASHLRKICVVGDEDQSIYSWRGADIRNILDFETKFPESKLLKLEQNYRSSQNIIQAASEVISRNTHRKGKEMWTDNDEGEKVQIIECRDDRAESEFIALKIQELKREGISYDDMAVFYRSNAMSRQLEDGLRNRKIPYRIVAGIKFYERKEIKDILSYIRLVVNPKDSLALSRIINIPARGIGVGTLRKFEEYAVSQNLTLWEAVRELTTLDSWPMRASAKVKVALKSFVELIEEAQALEGPDNQNEESSPSHTYRKILEESGYMEVLRQDKSRESLARIENLEELHSGIKQYEEMNPHGGLLGFLETIVLDSEKEEENGDGMVSLMTIHGAKGLEYDVVFVSGNEENVFPSYLSIEDGEWQVEEERRLFYVAMTRAMKKLYLCYGMGRMLWGKIQFNPRSRFIDEVPEGFTQKENYPPREQNSFSFNRGYQETAKTKEFQDTDVYIEKDDGYDYDDEPVYYQDSYNNFTYGKGEEVIHQLYGKGVVVSNQGSGVDEKVTILFPGGVKKKFVVKYAPLERV